MVPVLGYWNIRGYAQPIRFLLAHVDQEYVEKDYGNGEDFDYGEWYCVKMNIGLDVSNLPYYKDGTVDMSESMGILRFLSDQHHLNPTTAEEKRRVYTIEPQLIGFRGKLPMALYCDDLVYKVQLKQEHIKAIPVTLESYSDFLGQNNWVAGDKLTYVDFLFYEVIFQQQVFLPGCIDEFANLKEYMLRFQALPNIAKYVQTDKFKGLLLFRPAAQLEANFNFPTVFSNTKLRSWEGDGNNFSSTVRFLVRIVKRLTVFSDCCFRLCK